MGPMTEDPQVLLSQFRQALVDCQRLYLDSAQFCIQQHPHLLDDAPQQFLQMMGDLHRGLLVKIYVCIVEADGRWSPQEQQLAECLFRHLWKRVLSGPALRDAVMHVSRESDQLEWSTLLQPFHQIAPLRDRVSQLETLVMRVANLIAKADGDVLPAEARSLQIIQQQIDRHLRDLPLDEPGRHEEAEQLGTQAIESIKAAGHRRSSDAGVASAAVPAEEPQLSAEQRLETALAQLDQLIGLEAVKHQVRTLTNYLKLQRQRQLRGLAQTPLSLHMVFTGNPGTGKTTVARIVGQIYGAMGVLEKGHLVETDRSGMVASYAGQTASKSAKKIDEALDGVLFIDEAYSLVAEASEDAYGHEALQTLLKRMEDDRERLVVILAGYPQPMQRLLKSNPGLISRFSTKLEFADYGPVELAQIFQRMCDKNQYVVDGPAQAKLMLGFRWLYERRDEHFGNGRLVRNTFENAIRRLANRIVSVVPLTEDLLTRIKAEDIEFAQVPEEAFDCLKGRARFVVICPGCTNTSRIRVAILGRRVKCKRCGERFTAAWGEPDEPVH